MSATLCRREPLRWCEGMNKNVEGGVGKGLRTVVALNLKAKVGAKRATRILGVRYCTTAKQSDPGLMLNSCPWCGTDLRWWESA